MIYLLIRALRWLIKAICGCACYTALACDVLQTLLSTSSSILKNNIIAQIISYLPQKFELNIFLNAYLPQERLPTVKSVQKSFQPTLYLETNFDRQLKKKKKRRLLNYPI